MENEQVFVCKGCKEPKPLNDHEKDGYCKKCWNKDSPNLGSIYRPY
jgi:hypothetical protein